MPSRFTQENQQLSEYGKVRILGNYKSYDLNSGTLVVRGDAAISGSVRIGGNTIGDDATVLTTPLTFTDPNAQNGFVMTSTDATGDIRLLPKFWGTNDNPELVGGPSDSFINTTYSVGIDTATPSEKLHVSTSTAGEGAQFGNVKAGVWATATTSGILTNSALKAEATSFGLRMRNDGLTVLNSKLEIDFSIDDSQVATITNSGDMGIGIEPTEKLHVNGNTIIEGDLTVNGTTTIIDSETIQLEDPLIKLGRGNTADASDIGFYGLYIDAGTTKFSGLARDASETDKKFILFNNMTNEPTTTIAAPYDHAELQAAGVHLDNGITGTTDMVFRHGGLTFYGNSGVDEQVYFNDDGTVGIGVSAPDDTFQVAGSGAFSGNVSIGTTNSNVGLCVATTDAIRVSSGTAAQRPTGEEGLFRFNTDGGVFEAHDGTDWFQIFGVSVVDSDGDTRIVAEENPDEDKLRFYTAGVHRMIVLNTGQVGIGTSTPTVQLAISGTDAILIPVGETAQRPAGSNGFVRYNSDRDVVEAYVNSSWEILNGLRDRDNDTKILVEQTADDDKIRFLTAGGQRMVVDENGLVGIGVSTPTVALEVNGTIEATDMNISNNVTISGDLTVEGTTTTIDSESLVVVDPLIKTGKDNISDLVDLGMYSQYLETGTTKFSGFYRDATDNKIKLFTGLEVEPTTTVDTGAAGYTDAVVKMGTAETDIVKYNTNLNINNSSDATRVLVTDGGFVGVGTTANYPLHVTTANASSWSARFVNGTSDILLGNQSINGASINSGAADANTSYALTVRNNDSANIFHVRNDKVVGINTAAPANDLEISTSTAARGVKSGVAFVGNASSTIAGFSHHDFAATIASQAIKQNASGETTLNSASSQSLYLAISDSNRVEVTAAGNVVIGSASTTTNLLNVGGDTKIDGILNVGTTHFHVESSSGFVGVNTSNPSEVLHVSGAGIKVSDIGASDATKMLHFYEGDGTGANFFLESGFSGTDANAYMSWKGFDGVSTTTTAMVQTMSGNVGIGTITPSVALDVNGSINAQDDLTVTDDFTVGTNVLDVDTGNAVVAIGTTAGDAGITDEELYVNGDAKITGDLVVGGTLTFEGISVDGLEIQDSLLKINSEATDDTRDAGVYNLYVDGIDKYSGYFRDVTDNKFKFFTGLEVEPTTTVDTGAAGYTNGNMVLGQLEADSIICPDISTFSDMRIKENITQSTNDDILEKMKHINSYRYNFKGNTEKKYGFIAQELDELLPGCVKKIKHNFNGQKLDDLHTVDGMAVSAYSFEAIKELIKQNEVQGRRIGQLEDIVCRMMVERI